MTVAFVGVLLALGLLAAVSAAVFGGPASGRHPIACAPAPCQQAPPYDKRLMPVSPLVKFTIEPHVLHLGQVVHMHRNGYCDPRAGATCYVALSRGGPDGNTDPGLTPCTSHDSDAVSRHPTFDATFCLRATSDTKGWQVAGAGGEKPNCDPVPGDNSSTSECQQPGNYGTTADYYLVDNSLTQLSGTVAGGPHNPLQDVKVTATGPGHKVHVTFTDPYGNYAFALRDGTYRVRASHKHVTPKSRTVVLRRKPQTGVDFEVPVLKLLGFTLHADNNHVFLEPSGGTACAPAPATIETVSTTLGETGIPKDAKGSFSWFHDGQLEIRSDLFGGNFKRGRFQVSDGTRRPGRGPGSWFFKAEIYGLHVSGNVSFTNTGC